MGMTGWDRDKEETQKYLVRAIMRLATAIEKMNERSEVV